jgi:tetratricopeptide (TPR) repeat protein
MAILTVQLKMKKKPLNLIKAIFLITVFLAAIAFFERNSYSLRLKIADSYIKNKKYEDAIVQYKKILRKDKVLKSLKNQTIGKIYFQLGNLYSKLKLRNLAIEHYAWAAKNYWDFDGNQYYTKSLIDLTMPIGLLEAGEWEKARIEFRNTKELLRGYFPEYETYLSLIDELKNEDVSTGSKNFVFLLGDSYIQFGLFDEAREFFTKRILDYGVDHLEVLKYLNNKYGNNKEIIQKIWGNDIFVILEDFEEVDTQLVNWVSTHSGKVNSHYIDGNTFCKGFHSEWLDLSYSRERQGGNYDYWAKAVNISLDSSDLELGIRFYVKSLNSQEFRLALNILFKNKSLSGICSSMQKREFGNGWFEYSIDNLLKQTNDVASNMGCSYEGAMIDKVLFDTGGISNKFFVDNIELYLINKSN